jgi:hypothetical protein
MNDKLAKAIENLLAAAEEVYGPYTGDGEGNVWNLTLRDMEKLKRAAHQVRKAQADAQTP